MSRLPKNQLALKIRHTKRAILKSKWALSTVVTTLIILVISVLLASVVTYFAINVVSTRVQEESLALTKQHIWYSKDGTQAVLMIINTGGRDVVIQKFAIRGQTVDWKNVYYATTNAAVSADLPCHTDIAAETTSIGSTPLTFVKASDSLTLQSGYSMVLYINSPDSITINDVGLTVSITLNTAQAMYYVEANVQAVGEGQSSTTQTVAPTQAPEATPTASPTPTPASGADIAFTYLHAYYDGSGNQVGMVVKNNGDTSAHISLVKANNVFINQLYVAVGSFTGLTDIGYMEDLSKEVQGHTLSPQVHSFDVPAGQTAIVYGAPATGLGGDPSIISQSINVILTIQGYPTVTQAVTVEEGTRNL